jgi:competence protein ComEC
MWLLYISCAWVAGIFVGSKASFPLVILLSPLLPLFFLPTLPKIKINLIIISLCLLAFSGGGLYYTTTLPQINEQALHFYNDKEVVQIQGMVAKEPDIRDKYCLLTFSSSVIAVANTDREVSGTALIYVSRYPFYHYGDILKVTGKMETPASFTDFDYRSYLFQQRIYSIIYYPKIEIIARGQGLRPLQWLYLLRARLSTALNQVLPEPQASLAQGILLGIRGNISQQLYQQFSITGTAHLLAISGLHISIIVIILLHLSILIFGRKYSLYIWVVILITWFYVLLSGMQPPVIRAATMATLFLIAELLGRQRSAITALAFAAAVMIAINPQILWSNSFQLSFMAMCGLIFLYPHIHIAGRQAIAILLRENNKLINMSNLFVDTIAVTLAAIIATWPIVAYYFQIFSLIALPANLFALPALSVIIVSVALVAFSGLLIPFIAPIIGWIAWLFLSYLLLVVQSFSTLPFCYLESIHISTWQIWIYYIMLAIFVTVINNRNKYKTSPPSRQLEVHSND